MKLVVANIRDNPDLPAPRVRADMREVAALRPSVIFWQEIGEREDHRAINQALPLSRWYHLFGDRQIPISLRKSHWKVEDAGLELMHEGRENASPHRYVAWVQVRRRVRFRAAARCKRLVLMNTHFVSGAWNAKAKPHKDWRKDAWILHWRRMQAVVNRFHKRGLTVVFGGDFNRAEVADFLPGQQWAVNGGIDKIGFVEADDGVQIVRRGSTRVVNLFSDHHARMVDLQLVT